IFHSFAALPDRTSHRRIASPSLTATSRPPGCQAHASLGLETRNSVTTLPVSASQTYTGQPFWGCFLGKGFLLSAARQEAASSRPSGEKTHSYSSRLSSSPCSRLIS